MGWVVHWIQMGVLFQVQNKIYGGEFAFQRQKSTSSLSRIMISVHQNQPSSSKLLLTLVMRYLSQVYLSRRWQGVKISTSSRTFYWLKKTFLKNWEWSKENEIEIPNLEKHYEIVVFNTSEDYDIGGLSHVPNKLICFLI